MTLFLAALALQLAGGALAFAFGSRPRLARRIWAVAALAGGVLGLASAAPVLIGAAAGDAWRVTLPWSVPGGRLNLGMDALSAVFLAPVFALSALIAVYGAGYLSAYEDRKPIGGQLLFYSLLAASMELVIVARNGILFLAAWESMSLASFFLVAYEDEKPEVRAASRLYLVAMHLGTAFLLLLFALMGGAAGTYDLAPFAPGSLSAGTATLFFVLALAGFGTKAGFWPLHVWLPKAHPAAPSHVSALMSGVMIKTGIYGLCRILLLLGAPRPSWGLALLAIGAVSGVLGVLYALAQHDLKALLAYHSEENIGIIALGLGAGLLGVSSGNGAVAALGFTGALLHVWNHGLFKGLLFLGAGSVLRATHTRELEKLGGLWKRMPFTAGTFLVGAAAISGLPPLNGLVSEWLIFTGLFRAGVSAESPQGLATLAAAAVLALVGGLALACFAKAVGVVFLGEPRSEEAGAAREAPSSMTVPMLGLAGLCLAIGVLPPVFTALLNPASAALAGTTPGAKAGLAELSTWSGPCGTLGLISGGTLVAGLVLLGVRRRLLSHRVLSASPTWDCGYHAPSPRMQYTASSFAEPLTTLFRPLLATRLHLVAPRGYFPRQGSFASHPEDGVEEALWNPLFRGAAGLLGRLRFLQQGRVHSYLAYIFVTLVALLAWALVS